MKIAICCSTLDECDLIELHARHHARLADVLIYCDDSRDTTPEILKQLAAEGLGARLVSWSSRALGVSTLAYRQNTVMNASLDKAFTEFGVDYAIPVDTDEFVQAKSRAELEEALATIPSRKCGYYFLKTYVPTKGSHYHTSANPLYSMFRRRVPEGGNMPKTVMTRELFEFGAVVSVGSHCIGIPTTGEGIYGHKLPLGLAHVPVRSSEQIVARVISTCPKVWGPQQAEQNGGYYVDQWMRDRRFQISDDDLLHLAMTRVCPGPDKPTATDPDVRMVSPEISIRYPDLARINPMAVVERLVEDLARERFALMQKAGA